MGDIKLRGVNLGGWLVLERWITPSLFEGTEARDEFSFMRLPGAVEKITVHRRSFMTEDDFRWLNERGVNAVRIPVGYWLFEASGPFVPCVEHLDWAFRMAEKYKLNVLVDLHGAKGSQNGNDHSGQIGKTNWSHYKGETLQLLKQIAERYKDSPALWGIELLNEPRAGRLKTMQLQRFYREAYKELVQIIRPGTYIVFSDGFSPQRLTGSIRPLEGYPVAMDVHWYQVGKANLQNYFKDLMEKAREIEQLERQQPIIVGEWSGMLSHRSLEGYSESEQTAVEKRHIVQQLMAYQGALGWFYWTYKTESDSIWNFRSQVENGSLLLSEYDNARLGV